MYTYTALQRIYLIGGLLILLLPIRGTGQEHSSANGLQLREMRTTLLMPSKLLKVATISFLKRLPARMENRAGC